MFNGRWILYMMLCIAVSASERLKEERGQPQQISVDNGPELISVKLLNY